MKHMMIARMGAILLAILTVLSLVSLVLPLGEDRIKNTPLTRTLNNARSLAIAIYAYKDDHRALPATLQDLKVDGYLPQDTFAGVVCRECENKQWVYTPQLDSRFGTLAITPAPIRTQAGFFSKGKELYVGVSGEFHVIMIPTDDVSRHTVDQKQSRMR